MSGCSHSTPAPAAETYGGLPTFLPKASGTSDSVLTGTAARPALTIQGDSVKVNLPNASVLATVVGPQIPGAGLPHTTSTTTCTWTVTLTAATAVVPVTAAEFTVIDHLGAVYHPTLVPGQPVPSATVTRGQTVTFELRTIMTTGEGLMRWAPVNQQTVATWDFTVEND